MSYIVERDRVGAFHSLIQDMAEQDPRRLKLYLRMSESTFDDLLRIVGPLIQKQETNWSRNGPIHPAERLAVTLRFLAQGIFCQFLGGRTTIARARC
jgi:hypothetical protein